MTKEKGKNIIPPESGKFNLESKELKSILNVIKDQITNNNKDEVTIVANINIENNNSSELEPNTYKSVELTDQDKDSLIDYILNHLHTFNSNQITKLKKGLFQYGKNKLEKLSQSNIKLSKREKEILIEICNGLNNNQIARKKFISRRTVDTHRTNLLSKTNCKNAAQLVVWAIRNNLYVLP